jgi:4-diphosphocytidyl-2-C-methyl-D-erythritol kinase
VTAPLVEQASAKINLTLRVLGRRADGYHLLESLVVFADLADTLSLQPGGDATLAVSGPFAEACGSLDGNLVLKAFAKLRERVPGLKAGRFQLAKHIPVAAGLGGGSADAAAALRLLARANGLAPGDARLMAVAPSVGADVPVCLASRACIMRGVGEELSAPLDLPPLPALLVNPGVTLATRDVFAAFAGRDGGKTPLGAVPREPAALIDWLAGHGNDLTQPAITCAPIVADVLKTLGDLPGARLARMSGSGSTCFALFASAAEAQAAAAQLAGKRKDWWVHATTFGAVEKRP